MPTTTLDVTGAINTTTVYKIGGTTALYADASNNVALGPSGFAGTGADNIAIGHSALAANTTGASNVAIGSLTLAANLIGNNNVAVGWSALTVATGSQNTCVGYNAGAWMTTGGANTAVGYLCLNDNKQGGYNTAVGTSALSSNQNSGYNTAVGFNTLYDLNTAGSVVNQYNTAVGTATGRGIVTGGFNTILGSQVGGLAAGLTGALILATGDGVIHLDYGATTASTLTLPDPINATGKLTFTTATSGPVLKRGANGLCGTFVLNGVTPVVVGNTNVATTDAIIISLNTVGGTVGAHPAIQTITGGTGFTVAGTASDTSTYNYSIIKNAA